MKKLRPIYSNRANLVLAHTEQDEIVLSFNWYRNDAPSYSVICYDGKNSTVVTVPTYYDALQIFEIAVIERNARDNRT